MQTARRIAILVASLLAVAGCVTLRTPPSRSVTSSLWQPAPSSEEGSFIMRDGAHLPYRAWLPEGPPQAVVLALHGFNDSRDAWEIPAPSLAASGIAVFSPDQRGFGAAPGRGVWAGSAAMVDDARSMTALLRARFPKTRLVLMGESMGGAVLMVLATSPDPPAVDGYVLVAPAVWGRARMNVFLRTALWLASHAWPGLTLSGSAAHVTPSDNRDAMIRLSTDPLTIKKTRMDTLRGLVDLMDQALAAAPSFHAPALFLYGGRDDLVPEEATAATWQALGPSAETAFYPKGHHLLLRDRDRAVAIADVTAWILGRPLPSGAAPAARTWLAGQQ